MYNLILVRHGQSQWNLENQTRIGWDTMLKGFVTKEWQAIMEKLVFNIQLWKCNFFKMWLWNFHPSKLNGIPFIHLPNMSLSLLTIP